MRMLLLLAGLAGSVALIPAAASPASTATAFTFGRSGGNIRPFTVTITRAGAVAARGTTVGRHRLAPASVERLLRFSRALGFFTLPTTKDCPRTLPDVATESIRVATAAEVRRVRVHGGCLLAFNRLFAALSHAVAVS